MKVISQSKGISKKLWLLQRPGTLGPMTLFMCEVRQTALSQRQLKWLMIFFSPHINLPTYNPCASLAICTAKSKRQRDQKTRDRLLIVNGCHSADVCAATCSSAPAPLTRAAKLFSSTCIYSEVQTEILDTVNARALLSVHVCSSRFLPFLHIYV